MPSASHAQGFGSMRKKTIKLQRKLPAAVHLPGNALDVRVTSHDPAYANSADMFSDLVTTDLQKFDKDLRVTKTGADVVITCVIVEFQTPPPTRFTRTDVAIQKKKGVPEQQNQYYKVTGEVTISYSAKDAHGRAVDSDNIVENYAQDFESGTNAADGESAASKAADPFKRLAGKKTTESYGPPTPVQLRQILLTRAANDISARLVTTDETIEVPLARGKLDAGDKFADDGQWSRYTETLETMTPLPNPQDDAYRQYNIGVGYEALGYQTQDPAGAKKLFQQAAIAYGIALDAKPEEKPFVDAQTRIETAVAHFKKLSSTAAVPPAAKASEEAAESKPETSSRATSSTAAATPASKPAAGSSAPASRSTGRGTAASTPASTASPAPSASASKSPALTNNDVIRMAKSGVDEDSIVSAIHDAANVNFDLTPDGLINLANNGVKGKIVGAMRDRSHAHRSGNGH
ncbi:MAG TPA: hypothetical protein VN862_11735 [Candidatus Acidoferrales bacterium]|nr:hypothetical protein [Candidatus Acidoferrales bacterium]